jgi:hypothetical protein
MKSNEQFIKENVSTVRKGYQMMETMLKIIDILQHNDTVSSTELEKQVGRPVKASLDWLEQFGKVKAENRKEEFITVKCHDTVCRDSNGQIVSKNVIAIVDGKEYMIINPRLRERGVHIKWEDIEKQIQVTRKYYKWVG